MFFHSQLAAERPPEQDNVCRSLTVVSNALLLFACLQSLT